MLPSLVERAGARLTHYHDNLGQCTVRVGDRGIASMVLTRESGQCGYVPGIACLDAKGRVMSQAILGPGWEVAFEEPTDARA